jgi:hypothetical protein
VLGRCYIISMCVRSVSDLRIPSPIALCGHVLWELHEGGSQVGPGFPPGLDLADRVRGSAPKKQFGWFLLF